MVQSKKQISPMVCTVKKKKQECERRLMEEGSESTLNWATREGLSEHVMSEKKGLAA